MKNRFAFAFVCLLFAGSFASLSCIQKESDHRFISITVDPKKDDIGMFWKNDNGEILENFQTLDQYLKSKGRTIVFAMNGGMYKTDLAPLGLFIEEYKTLSRLNTATGKGNFYLQPNGIFSINADKKAAIVKTAGFKNDGKIRFATQSGPLIVIDGEINPIFTKGSSNVNIRNGVGILPEGKVVFAISKAEVNFYDFAAFFRDLGCVNALYLDGFVSRVWFPEKGVMQNDGNFGVMIAVTSLARK